jgi:predicted acyl esterase
MTRDPYQLQADWLCRAFSNATPLTGTEIEDHFAPAFLAQTSPADLTAYFSRTAGALGDCVSAERPVLLPNTAGITLQTFFLTMASGKRLVVSFDLDRSRTDSPRMASPVLSTVDAEQGVLGPSENYRVGASRVPAKDGARLQTIIFNRPSGPPRPVVVIRTPYFRLNGQFQYAHYYATADYYLNEGYAFVLQAIRGTGGSEGEFRFFDPVEIDDGDAAISWVRAQDFCNGRIAIVGLSYDGLTALAAGVTRPRGLEVIMAGGSPVDAANGPFIRGGLVLASQLDYIRYNATQTGPPKDEAALEAALRAGALHEPDVRKYDEILTGRHIPEWRTLADHFGDAADPFWESRQFLTELHKIDVPTYHIAGTCGDGDLTDVLNNFAEISRNPRAEHPERHRLIVGDWPHGGSIPYDDGRDAGEFIRERYRPLLAWHLKGVATPYAGEPRVQVASNIPGRIHRGDVFPPAVLSTRTVHFHEMDRSGGSADASTYLCLPEELNEVKHLDARQYLRFTYALEEDLLLLGDVEIELFLRLEGITEDAPAQTDVLAHVAVQDRQGEVQPLSACLLGRKVHAAEADHDGVIRMCTQRCFVQRHVTRGETMLVRIASNLFPMMLRNTGNAPGAHYYDGFRSARITLLHSQAYPSRIRFSLE